MASFPLACILTSSPSFHKHPNKFVVPKSSKLSSSKKTLPLPVLASPCKPFSHATSSRSSKLTTSAKTSSTNDVAAKPQTLTLEQWKIERETLSKQIDSLEQKVQQLTSESSSPKPSVEGILRDFVTLGQKFFEVKPKEDTTLPPTFTKAMMNLSSKLQQLASPEDDGLLHLDPQPDDTGPNPGKIDDLVKQVFDFYYSVVPIDPKSGLIYRKGNYAPVDDTPPTTNIVVEEGEIPETLNGMMLRNGPNPKFDPEGSYMWMDGDSMIHGIRFKNGEIPTYVARSTKTSRYLQQEKLNRSQVLMYGDQVGPYGEFAIFVDAFRKYLKILDISFGDMTTANTGLVYHGRRIMALEDFGKPHVIFVTEEGDLKTLGINNYDEKLDHWLTPHPRIDPESGEMFNLGSMREYPYCIYRKFSEGGDISDPVNIDVPYSTYMHELSITEHHVIFQLLPVCYDEQAMRKEDNEFVFSYDFSKTPRYGILHRDATSAKGIQWFDFPDNAFFVFHNVNAWEEDEDKIVLYCCNMESDTNKKGEPYLFPMNFKRYHDFLPTTTPYLYKMTFNLETNVATQEEISNIKDIPVDWPKINEHYRGRKTRYAYLAELQAPDENNPNSTNKIVSILKYDMEQEKSNPMRFPFGTAEHPEIYGSEVVFVPNTDSSTDEDDGYLITFVHKEVQDTSDEKRDDGPSYVYVIDAKTMKSVAKLLLPARVPYGFHAIYVTEEQLKNQIQPACLNGTSD